MRARIVGGLSDYSDEPFDVKPTSALAARLRHLAVGERVDMGIVYELVERDASVWVPDPDAPSRRLDAFQADIDNLNLTGKEET